MANGLGFFLYFFLLLLLFAHFGKSGCHKHKQIITDYLHKIRSKFCHTHNVNPLTERVENCYVDGVTIIGVPFCGLKEIEVKNMEI